MTTNGITDSCPKQRETEERWKREHLDGTKFRVQSLNVRVTQLYSAVRYQQV